MESIFLYENTLTSAINFVKINIVVQQFTFATQGAVEALEELKVLSAQWNVAAKRQVLCLFKTLKEWNLIFSWECKVCTLTKMVKCLVPGPCYLVWFQISKHNSCLKLKVCLSIHYPCKAILACINNNKSQKPVTAFILKGALSSVHSTP